MRPGKKPDSLESFLRKQERIIKQNELYKRLTTIPVVVIVFSLLIISYGFMSGIERNDTDPPPYTVEAAAQPPEETEILPQLINLNTATAEMLETLPGIGPKKAEAIIETRNRMGGFRSVEDVLNVKGIGEVTFAKIKDMVCVENE